MSRPDELLMDRLRQVQRRLLVVDVLHAIATGATLATVVLVTTRFAGLNQATWWLSGVALVSGVLGWLLVHRNSRSEVVAALAAERALPRSRNVVFTAVELLHRDGTPGYVKTRVLGDADAHVRGLNPGVAVPFGRPLGLLALAVACFAGASSFPPEHAASKSVTRASQVEGVSTGRSALSLRVELVPPAYTGRAAAVATDPASLDVLEGTRARFSVLHAPPDLTLRFNGRDVVPATDANGATLDVVLSETGYVSLASDGDASARRLIPVRVTPDRAPDVKISAPARDLLLADSTGNVQIAASASDDLALGSFELHYTRISGGGEQFEFSEGVMPLDVRRNSERDWQGHAALALGSLKLEPGDALVYRAVAKDRRPGDAGLASSDTYFVEIVGPGQVALAGVDMPPDQDRYALSQQMIVLKIERLLAVQGHLAPDVVADRAGSIGAEQRVVRANFIFLMGGTVEDEEVEAQESNEIQEGRLENDARREILAATRLMSQVERALARPDVTGSLPPAKAAAQALQRAFGRNRYLLRALPDRSRIDPSRRLSADLRGAADWKRPVIPSFEDPRVDAARTALSRLRDARAELATGSIDPNRLGAVGESILAIDPASPTLQEAARTILQALDALRARRRQDALVSLDRAAAAVVAVAQQGRSDSRGFQLRRLDRLAGAVATERHP